MPSRLAILRRALTATLAVLLALPAVGLACPPEMRDACPLMTPEPPAEECPMGSMSGHGDHSSADAPSQSFGRGLPSCCVSDVSGTPTVPATATPRIETPAASMLPTALPTLTLATTAEAQAHAPPIRALVVPLYTLHSSLLS